MVCKTHQDKKIEIMNKQYNLLTQCTVEFLHWVIQVSLKLFCLKLGPYSFTKFLHYNQKDLWLAPFLQVKNSVANSAGLVSVGTMQLTLSIAITQVSMSVVIMQVLRFYCNYVSGNFHYNYVGESFCYNYAGRWLFLLQLWS